MTPWGAMTIRASCEAWHARGLVGGWPQKGHEGQGRIEEEQGRSTGSRASLLARDKLQSRETWGLLTAPHLSHPSVPFSKDTPDPPTLPSQAVDTLDHRASGWHPELLCSIPPVKEEKSLPKLTHTALVFPGAGPVLSLGLSCALQVSRVTARLITPLSHRGFYFWFGFLLC